MIQTKPLLIQAFEGTNEVNPVWFMRQAGRYLPDYRALKEKHSLLEMFQTPELAAKITLMPIEQIGTDAAILFADILTLPIAMGFDINFHDKRGPIVRPYQEKSEFHDIGLIHHITDCIKIIKNNLDDHTALIGFAGSPFTVLTYLLEGGSSHNFKNTFHLMCENPEHFHSLMNSLTENTITYLNQQKEAGIDCYQIFDTWAGILPEEIYLTFVFPYLTKIFKSIDLPSIYFIKNSGHLISTITRLDADFLSLDHTINFSNNQCLLNSKKGIQGNFFNGWLYADNDFIKNKVEELLHTSKIYQNYIFNLNHGVFPDVNPDKLKFITECVHQFKQ